MVRRGPLTAPTLPLRLQYSGPAFTYAHRSRDALCSHYTRGPAGGLLHSTRRVVPSVIVAVRMQSRYVDFVRTQHPHDRSHASPGVGPIAFLGVSSRWRHSQLARGPHDRRAVRCQLIWQRTALRLPRMTSPVQRREVPYTTGVRVVSDRPVGVHHPGALPSSCNQVTGVKPGEPDSPPGRLEERDVSRG